jgi:hypothetical protein
VQRAINNLATSGAALESGDVKAAASALRCGRCAAAGGKLCVPGVGARVGAAVWRWAWCVWGVGCRRMGVSWQRLLQHAPLAAAFLVSATQPGNAGGVRRHSTALSPLFSEALKTMSPSPVGALQRRLGEGV